MLLAPHGHDADNDKEDENQTDKDGGTCVDDDEEADDGNGVLMTMARKEGGLTGQVHKSRETCDRFTRR